jgi:hypothetical protein
VIDSRRSDASPDSIFSTYTACASLCACRLPSIRIFTTKEKSGVVERISDGESGTMVTVIGKGMFKPETDLSRFLGLPVETEAGAVCFILKLWVEARCHGSLFCCPIVPVQVGVLESSFGKSGKFKVHFRDGAVVRPGTKLTLRMRKYVSLHAKGTGHKFGGGGIVGGAGR